MRKRQREPCQRRLITLLADRGAWREAEPILRAHGPDSAEFRALCLRVIGAGRCAVCGEPFVRWHARQCYCGNTCALAGFAARQKERRVPVPTPETLPGRSFASGRTFGKLLSHGRR